MRTFGLLILALLVVVAGTWWYISHRKPASGASLAIYYTKMDGTSMGTWNITMRPQQPGESDAEHLRNTALYAAVQTLAGPPSEVAAIRFPAGTHLDNLSVTGSAVDVDLSNEVTHQSGGSFGENGEFKELVYTMTGLPGIDSVQVTVDGRKLETLPGGHLELDEPLHRSDF